MKVEEKYMRRALALARKGLHTASPNPMVGAVIVAPDGTILGEGYHRKCGEAHAEVNAINSVADKSLLRDCTLYVTLEPCSHYGRTAPCAELIIRVGIPRVVVAVRDPFEKVNGKGIEMMRQAGIEVVEGVMEKECRDLNVLFFTAHQNKRPFIGLKWAQTADGYIDGVRGINGEAVKISSPITFALTHRLRAVYDAIMVGSGTVLTDNPTLTTRFWPGDSPLRIVLDRRNRVTQYSKLMSEGRDNTLIINDDKPLAEIMRDLYDKGITSVLVEGGAQLLNSFIKEGLWDFARVEVSPLVLGVYGTVHAPRIEGVDPVMSVNIEGHTIRYYSQNEMIDVKNL